MNTAGVEFREISIPKEMEDEAALYRSRLIESIAELDEPLTEKYLSGEPIWNLN